MYDTHLHFADYLLLDIREAGEWFAGEDRLARRISRANKSTVTVCQ